MIDGNKVINGLKNCSIQNDVGCQCCPYFEDRKKYGHEWCTTALAQDALDLLKEQQEQIDNLIEENASNAEMVEGLRELLKEQEGQVQQWTKEIADNQLAHAPDEFDIENWDYKKGIWDGLQIAWNIISEGR